MSSNSSAHRFFVNAALRRFALLCSMASEEQLLEIGEAIEERAAERAPRGATGDLSSTHRTETTNASGGIKAKVVFGTPSGMPYVVVQHEHTEFQHPNGGEAKFLEKTVNEYTPKVSSMLAQALKEEVLWGE